MDLQWSDLRQPKRAWFIAGGLALGTVILNRTIFDTPSWLLGLWLVLLLSTGFLFDWLKAARARSAATAIMYVLVVALSAFLIVERKPLTVQEVSSLGVFSPNPQNDPRVQGMGRRTLLLPLYASGIYIVTNNTSQPVTFQAILKVDLEDREDLLAALALGDRAGWSRELEAFFRELLDYDAGYLLSPVTVGANESVRGRFLFRIITSNNGERDQLRAWAAAFDPTKPLNGTAYIDLRDFSNGQRLAEPLFLLSKHEPD
jgi:hypothetical protein